jgi:hypothetical protein
MGTTQQRKSKTAKQNAITNVQPVMNPLNAAAVLTHSIQEILITIVIAQRVTLMMG